MGWGRGKLGLWRKNMINNKITIMPSRDSSKYSEKLIYLENLINDLYKEEQNLLPVFLLRCQLVEFSLKYLLVNYPYNSDNFNENEIEKLTMGQVVIKLKKINDSYMENITKNASDLVIYRNELTHNFIKSDMNIDEINKNIKEGMKFANSIEENIFYYIDFIEKELYGLK